MPRGRAGFTPYFEEYHEHGRADGPGENRPNSYQNVNVYNPNRNFINEQMHFGAQIGYIII